MNPISKVNPFATNNVSFQPKTFFPEASQSLSFVDSPNKASFKDVMTNLIQDTDKTLSVPDDLMERAMTTGDVDIHEVMIANTKADIAINIASQVVTKIVQAYERVQQIQV